MSEFVKEARPQIGVFTMGYRNRFGHPQPQVVARFREQDTRILRSDTGGLIKLTFSEAGVTTTEYRPSHRRYWQGSTP